MKKWIRVLLVSLALLLLAQCALAATLAPRATVGENVELEGKLTVFKKTAANPVPYAILTLDEPTVFVDEAGRPSEPQKTVEIRPTPAKSVNNKTVRVRGELIGLNDTNLLKTAFGVNPATVTVIPNPASVVLNQKTATLKLQDTLTLTTTVKPAAAKQAVTWGTSSAAVATVDTNGTVTAVGTGKAVITAKAVNGKKATCTVTVPVSVTGVRLNSTTLELKKGQTKQLTATVEPTNAANKKVAWTSSNPAVATVSAKGLVKAVSDGSATLQATTQDGGLSALCDVTVGTTQPQGGIEYIWLENANQFLRPGETTQITVHVEPESATLPTLHFKSTNSDVVTVDANGLVTARGLGIATVYAETALKDPEGNAILPHEPYYVTNDFTQYQFATTVEDYVITIDNKRFTLGTPLSEIKTKLPGGVESSTKEHGLMYRWNFSGSAYTFYFDENRLLSGFFIYEGMPGKTHRGIGPGDTLDYVLSIYGEGSFYSDYDKNTRQWVYSIYYGLKPYWQTGDDTMLLLTFGIDRTSLRVSHVEYEGVIG